VYGKTGARGPGRGPGMPGPYRYKKQSRNKIRGHSMNKFEALDKGLQSMNSYAEYLEERINQVSELEKILKDLERSWIRK
jgi:hypothetical protein